MTPPLLHTRQSSSKALRGSSMYYVGSHDLVEALVGIAKACDVGFLEYDIGLVPALLLCLGEHPDGEVGGYQASASSRYGQAEHSCAACALQNVVVAVGQAGDILRYLFVHFAVEDVLHKVVNSGNLIPKHNLVSSNY